MLHHVELYVSDLEVTRAFWTDLLTRIGYQESAAWDGGFTLEGRAGPYLTFLQVAEEHAASPYHRCQVGLNHLAFGVEGRQAVDTLRQHCLQRGIPCLYDDRYPFANGGTDYHALFVEDPDRIKVEFVAV
jgi:catechol 2,3-dioxygenase-like lactoylglutathione lyase family enzyme